MSMQHVTVTNASVVLPDQILEGATVRIEAGIIAAIDHGPLDSRTRSDHVVDADGAYLMPGVVDLHNDNLEFEVNPRANANLPLPFALSSMERRLAGAGVTTEFHAISFRDRPNKNRSVADAEAKAAYIAQFDDDPRHGVRHHILHRLDVRSQDSLTAALPTLRQVRVPYISLDDHSPGQGQYRDVERLIRMAQDDHAARSAKAADPDWYRQRMIAAQADAETVPAFYRRVAEALATLPVIVATHDDDTAEKVDQQLVLGASVAEFPVTFEAARHAREHGMTIVVGAPNIVRGGSQSGNLNAVDLIAAGLADVICADYHAPCLVPAAFRLWRDGVLDLPAAIRMITLNPARAVGLRDRGAIAPGLAADLAIVRLDNEGWPHVEATFVDGRSAFHFARHPDLVRSAPGQSRPAAPRQLQEQAV